jgi:PAS domain S-box-containing protein
MLRYLSKFLNVDNTIQSEYLKEDDFRKNLLSNGIGSLVIAPLLALVYYLFDFPSYVYLSVLSYAGMFPFYALFCAYNRHFRERLIYLLTVHLFFWSLINFLGLIDNNLSSQSIIAAAVSYILSMIIIQRLAAAIIYQIFALTVLIYVSTNFSYYSTGFLLAESLVLIVAVSVTLMMLARRAILNSLIDYSAYLKHILNATDKAFVLFTFSNGWRMLDNNENLSEYLPQEYSELESSFFELFSANELERMQALKTGLKFEKTYSFKKRERNNYIAIEISQIEVKKTTGFIAVLSDVTEKHIKQEELASRERKYRNLYDKNRAGVFTLDRSSVLEDANQAFHRMFENTISKGERLFSWDQEKDWKYILETMDDFGETGQNYQTNFTLSNGKQKTFVFNWYLDEDKQLIEGSVIDLTETQRATQALKQSEQKYRSIFEESNDAIFLLDGDLITEYNRTADEWFALSNRNNLPALFDLSVDCSDESERSYTSFVSQLGSKRNIKFNWEFESLSGKMETVVSFVEVNLKGKLLYQCVVHDQTEQNKLAKERARVQYTQEINERLEEEIKERIRAEEKLNQEFLRTKAILDSSSNTFLITVSRDKNITGFNTHSEKYFNAMFGITIESGQSFRELFSKLLSKGRLRLFNMYLSRVFKGASHQFEVKLKSSSGFEYWMEVFLNPIFNEKGQVSEISMVAHDISEKKKASIEIQESLAEKEVLLKEIHHRVKNNLQIISSILNLQSSFVTDENTLGILLESRNRIRSMAIIHESLYKTEDFASVDFSNYLTSLTHNLIASYDVGGNIELDTNVERVNLILDQAIPCGLLLNEIITNSLKYAWKDCTKNNTRKVDLSLNIDKNGSVLMEIGDNGCGLPQPFEKMSTETLGFQLISTLVEQLDGDLEVKSQKGTKYLIKFDSINH